MSCSLGLQEAVIVMLPLFAEMRAMMLPYIVRMLLPPVPWNESHDVAIMLLS